MSDPVGQCLRNCEINNVPMLSVGSLSYKVSHKHHIALVLNHKDNGQPGETFPAWSPATLNRSSPHPIK